MNNQLNPLEHELMLGGATPAEARELAGLARRLPEVRQLPLLQPPPSFKWGHQSVRRHLAVRRWTLAGLLTGVVAAAAFSAIAVTAAAQPAVPGQALYPVKLASEAVAVRLVPGFHDEMMMRRAGEVSALVDRHASPGLIRATLTSYNRVVMQDPASSYEARDYCSAMLKSASVHADPVTQGEIRQTLSRLKLDST